MTSANVRRLIQEQTESLGPLLHAAVATGLSDARRRLSGLSLTEHPHALAMLTRAVTRQYLEAEMLAGSWTVGGNPKLMSQLILENAELNISMRMLKGHFGSGGNGIPAAGRNHARRSAWAGRLNVDREMDLGIPTIAEATLERHAAGPIKLLWLWDLNEETDFQMRVAHPIEAGVFGREVPCDLLLDVKDGGEIFKRLEFTGSQEYDDLVGLIEVDEVESDSGS